MFERADGAPCHKPLNKSNLHFFAEDHASYAAPRAATRATGLMAFLDGIQLVLRKV